MTDGNDRPFRIGNMLAKAVDQLAYSSVLGRRRGPSKTLRLDPEQRLRVLAEVESTMQAHLSSPGFFPEGQAVSFRRKEVRESEGVQVTDVSWDSDFVPLFDGVSRRYLSFKENKRAHARLFEAKGKSRPLVVLLHGYLGGRYSVETRIWGVQDFLDAGFNVALPLLPFHSLRSATLRTFNPAFPSSDVRFTIDAFRQAMFDLRCLVSNMPHQGYGVAGMSLGAYTAVLWASLSPMDFVVPVTPLASLADFTADAGFFSGTRSQKKMQREQLESTYKIISPLFRKCQVEKQGRMVIAGEADQVTPLKHAELLASWLETDLVTFEGGHLLQVGRKAAFKQAIEMMTRCVTSPDVVL